jgi:hypothetical protein
MRSTPVSSADELRIVYANFLLHFPALSDPVRFELVPVVPALRIPPGPRWHLPCTAGPPIACSIG